jgi:hypothetical protein
LLLTLNRPSFEDALLNLITVYALSSKSVTYLTVIILYSFIQYDGNDVFGNRFFPVIILLRMKIFIFGSVAGEFPLGRPRRRWEDNIKADLQEVGCGGMDWIELAQHRDRWQALMNAVMNLRVT